MSSVAESNYCYAIIVQLGSGSVIGFVSDDQHEATEERSSAGSAWENGRRACGDRFRVPSGPCTPACCVTEQLGRSQMENT